MVGLGEAEDEDPSAAAGSARCRGYGRGDHRPISASDAAQSSGSALRHARRSSTRIATSGLRLGFKMVFSGPLVRSSYMADIVSEQARGHGVNWVLALATAALLIVSFPGHDCPWLAPCCARSADLRRGAGAAVEVALLTGLLSRESVYWFDGLQLDPIHDRDARRDERRIRRGSYSCCSRWRRHCSAASSRCWPGGRCERGWRSRDGRVVGADRVHARATGFRVAEPGQRGDRHGR